MGETTTTIAEWAFDTFGDAGSDARVAARANEEMAELLWHVTSGQPHYKIRDEISDVVIVLAHLSYRCGGDLWRDVEAKMQINRNREWKLDGSGHGYHVREPVPDPPGGEEGKP